MDKNDLISDLYTLRGGLSAISLKIDKLNELQPLLDFDYEKEIAHLESLKAKLPKLKIEDENERKKLELSKLEEKAETYKRTKRLPFDHVFQLVLGALVAFIIFVVIIGIFLGGIGLLLKWIFSSWVPLIIAGVLDLICAGFATYTCIPYSTPETYYNEALKKYKDSNAYKNYRSTLREIENKKSSIPTSKESHDSAVSESEVLHDEINKIAKALRESYDNLIDFRDWGNIDLIIFYFETGRADTLKEALYQVDRERQNERLIGALEEATSAIVDSINSSIARLGNRITNCTNRLNSNIARYEQESLSMQKATNKQLKNLNVKVDVSNSLLQKANVSSSELIEDLRFHQKNWIK